MDTNSSPMTNPCDPEWRFKGLPEMAFVAFRFAVLDFVLKLRETARKVVAANGPDRRDPREEMDSMLNELRQIQAPLSLPVAFVAEAIDNVEHVLLVHLESDYEDKWVALLAGCQDVADQMAVIVGKIADGFEENLEILELEGSTAPEILRSKEGFRNSITYMRVALALARQAGEPATA